MVAESSNKKNLSWIIVGIIILALVITVFMQDRRINALIKGANNYYPQEEAEKYKTKIVKLESQIVDMQAWQDYLEGALNENNKSSIPAPQNSPDGNRMVDNAPVITNNPALRNGRRSPISFRYDTFAEENDLSEETKSKLLDLLAEMQLEIMNRMPRRGGFSTEMIDREALWQQVEAINSIYDEKISELLSANELDAFKEYQNSESERMLIMGFNGIFEGDSLLDNEKEKELVAAMYNARQANPETKREDNTQSFFGRPFGPGQINEGPENVEKLNNIYLESARDILSEDEMEKFEGYINTRQSGFTMGRGPRPGRFQVPE